MIKKWLEQTIIGLNLCPYAFRPHGEKRVLITELESSEEQAAINEFLTMFGDFQNQEKYITALVGFPNLEIEFEGFYYLTLDCQDILEQMGLGDEYQLVSFHPDFCFEGLEKNNRANLVNSSPIPLINILRKVDLDLVNLSPEEAEELSHGNALKLETLTSAELALHFPWRYSGEG